jgi:hypothetical protein
MHNSFSRSTLLCALSLVLLAGCQGLTPPKFPTAPTTQAAVVEASPTLPPAAEPSPTTPPAPTDAGRVSAAPTLAPTSPAPADPALLQNATYPVEGSQSGSVTLVNGEYRESSAVVSAAETVVTFFKAAPGDLNQDGVPDAAVVLNVNTGGTGRFYYLYAAISQGDQFAISAPVYLGDRVIINLMQVDQGQIHLDMVVSGPNDPMCCPNTPASATYVYQEGQLVTLK